MPRKSKWDPEDRRKLLKLIKDGVPEQVIRERMGKGGRAMTSSEFAQQLKVAMVEAGKIKQADRKKKKAKDRCYLVTKTGRLTISDFGKVAGFPEGAKFTLQKPRSGSSAWRLVPVEA